MQAVDAVFFIVEVATGLVVVAALAAPAESTGAATARAAAIERAESILFMVMVLVV